MRIGGPADVPADLPMPRYRVAVVEGGRKRWLPWMRGLVDEGGSAPGWGKWEHDDDDGGAGNDADQLDMIELTIAPC